MDWLSQGLPEKGKKYIIKDINRIRLRIMAVDLDKGKQVFIKECFGMAMGEEGQGRKKPIVHAATFILLMGIRLLQ